MPHLPNEIWLQIASCCDHPDLWLSFRLVNRQLQTCAESHFKHEVLPLATLSLPVVLPTYDIRSPILGKAVFRPLMTNETQNPDLIVFVLDRTVPDYYRSHFLSRWASMRDAESGSLAKPRVKWHLDVCGGSAGVCLKGPMATTPDCEDDEARVEFEWKATLTRFYRLGHFNV